MRPKPPAIYSHNHKTVIVLDHGPKLLQFSNEQYDYDVVGRAKSALVPLAPLNKSHWTCCLEAGLEFCRIVYDIFGQRKLISFIASDQEAHSLTGWSTNDQDLDRIQQVFGLLGVPKKSNRSDEASLLYALKVAADQLLTLTPQQMDVYNSLNDDHENFQNNGRVICLTVGKSDNHIADLISNFNQTIVEKNKGAIGSDDQAPIHSCDLVVIVVHPVGTPCKVASMDCYEVSPLLTASIVISESGKKLAQKLVALAVDHFNLVITAVTGIPMKEEQNAGSSANYDVELLHSAEAHSELLTELADGVKAPSMEIEGVDSVTLKWCTPKTSSSSDMHQCTGIYPISPLDANSRPSLCLTNFLLGGRSVMLEQPKKSGSKILSHMLSSLGGQIYIHQLATGKSILEDPPSISEGIGGRITDYRIQDFCELIKDNLLVPAKPDSDGVLPYKKAEAKLERATRCWPITLGETILFSLQSHVDPLPTLIVKERLTEDDVHECRKAIFHLVGLEDQNQLTTYTVSKLKGHKKEEQHKMLWAELEALLQAHSTTSPQHAEVLDCLLSCRPQSSADDNKALKKFKLEKKEMEVMATDLSNSKSKPSTRTDSPIPHKRPKHGISLDFQKGNHSLLNMWSNRMNSVNSARHFEFAGRSAGVGNIAPLYRQLNVDLEPVDNVTPGSKCCLDL